VFCQGSTIILKIGTPQGKPEEQQPDIPNIQQESGHFFALDFGPLIGQVLGPHLQGADQGGLPGRHAGAERRGFGPAETG